MVESRVIAQQVGVSEKDMMLQSIEQLRNDVRNLSATISEKIGSRRNIDDIQTAVDDVFKKNSKKNKSMEQMAAEILENYKKTRQSEREEVQAQIRASFAIFEEKMKSPFRSASSAAMSSASNMVGDKSMHVRYENVVNDKVRENLKGVFANISKLLSPEKISQKAHDAGQINPNYVGNKPDDAVLKKAMSAGGEDTTKLIKVLNALKTRQNADVEKSKTIDEMIKYLDNDTKRQEIDRKKKVTVEDLAKEKERAYYDEKNDEKKEALSNWEAKKKIFKEKYLSGNLINSLASDAFSGAANMAGDTSTNVRYENVANQNMRSGLQSGLGFLGKKFQPWMPSGNEEKDVGQTNPNFIGDGDEYDPKSDAAETTKEAKERESIEDIEDMVYDLDHYVKHRLVDDIIAGAKTAQEGSAPASGGGEGEGEGEEGNGEEEGGGGLGMGTKMRMAKTAGKWGMRGLKAGGRLAMQGMRGGAGLLSQIGGGSAMAGAAVVALAAASAYTFYETGKTAMAITEGKSNVRESTKGSADAAVAKNQVKYTKDNAEVTAGANRYEKAGLPRNESVSTSLVERQNSKLVGATASMGGIFGAARQSTDFRSSEDEVTKLLEGEKLADTLRSSLQGLNARLADPAAVMKMSPSEINSIAQQIKSTMPLILRLKDTWEEAKKEGTGTFMNSQWLNDKTLVANGDAVVNSLVDSGNDINNSFNKWTDEMKTGAAARTAKKDLKKPSAGSTKKIDTGASTLPSTPASSTSPPSPSKGGLDVKTLPEPKSASDMASDRFGDLDDALETGKMKAPAGYRESTPADFGSKPKSASDSLNEKIGAIDKNTQPAIAKLGEDIKVAVTDQNSNLSSKLDNIKSQIDEISKKKAPPPPAQYSYAPDIGFSNINNLSRGS